MSEDTRIEILFNSVELEITRRWAMGNVPSLFTGRSAEDLKRVIKSWWHIYHESVCATEGRNRTVWERNGNYPAEALDTEALVRSLLEIRRLMNLDALRKFRPSPVHEVSAVCLLGMVTTYYAELKKH